MAGEALVEYYSEPENRPKVIDALNARETIQTRNVHGDFDFVEVTEENLDEILKDLYDFILDFLYHKQI